MARTFAERSVRPVAEALDRDESFPRDLYAEMGGLGYQVGASIIRHTHPPGLPLKDVSA